MIPDNTDRCQHKNVTLCQGWHPEDGRFTAYQCDDCGWVTNQDTPLEATMHGEDLPHIDENMWITAIDDHLKRLLGLEKEEKLHKAIGFFAKALYRGK